MKNDAKQDFQIDEQNKIYILGGKGVGKTTFFHLVFSNQFMENIEPSNPGIIKSNYKKGKKIFTIKELTDDENFTNTKILENELEDVILILVLFAINDKNSFEHAKTLIQFIKNNLINNKDLNIILLGNKYDIAKNSPESIQVKRKEVDKFIYPIENLYYYDLSCKTNYNFPKIKEIINTIDVDDEDCLEDNDDDDKKPDKKNRKKSNKARSCLIY